VNEEERDVEEDGVVIVNGSEIGVDNTVDE
jgi:hypothetical protein